MDLSHVAQYLICPVFVDNKKLVLLTVEGLAHTWCVERQFLHDFVVPVLLVKKKDTLPGQVQTNLQPLHHWLPWSTELRKIPEPGTMEFSHRTHSASPPSQLALCTKYVRSSV